MSEKLDKLKILLERQKMAKLMRDEETNQFSHERYTDIEPLDTSLLDDDNYEPKWQPVITAILMR